MHIHDLESDASGSDFPSITEVLYKIYPHQALWFELENLRKTKDFLQQLYPTENREGLDKMRQIIGRQQIIKFCHTAEILGAFSIAFLTTLRA